MRGNMLYWQEDGCEGGIDCIFESIDAELVPGVNEE